jgi:hypothetical protein
VITRQTLTGADTTENAAAMLTACSSCGPIRRPVLLAFELSNEEAAGVTAVASAVVAPRSEMPFPDSGKRSPRDRRLAQNCLTDLVTGGKSA